MKDKTCVMTGREGYGYMQGYKCSECQNTGHGDWKFCAYCGAEIIRFDHEQPPTHFIVQVHEEKPEPKMLNVVVGAETEPKR
jgi:hypothetical protein